MKKRIASLLMAVVMTATLGIGAMAATTEQVLVQGNNTGLSAANFKDLADNSKPDGRHWAWDSIDHVVKYGLFNGTSATTFAPQNPMTRAQFVVVVTRLENASRAANNKLNVERVPTETRFTDVPTDMWCAGAVAWAEANGIVEGYSDNTFRPNQAISRAQIAAFVYRYVNNYKKYNLKTVTPEPAQFTDFALASEVFHTAINYCRTHGLINGYGDHTLRPNISVTRAQVAAILSRIIIVLESRRGGGGGSGVNPTPTTTTPTGVNLTITGLATAGNSTVALQKWADNKWNDANDYKTNVDDTRADTGSTSNAIKYRVIVKADTANGYEFEGFTLGEDSKNETAADENNNYAPVGNRVTDKPTGNTNSPDGRPYGQLKTADITTFSLDSAKYAVNDYVGIYVFTVLPGGLADVDVAFSHYTNYSLTSKTDVGGAGPTLGVGNLSHSEPVLEAMMMLNNNITGSPWPNATNLDSILKDLLFGGQYGDFNAYNSEDPPKDEKNVVNLSGDALKKVLDSVVKKEIDSRIQQIETKVSTATAAEGSKSFDWKTEVEKQVTGALQDQTHNKNFTAKLKVGEAEKVTFQIREDSQTTLVENLRTYILEQVKAGALNIQAALMSSGDTPGGTKEYWIQAKTTGSIDVESPVKGTPLYVEMVYNKTKTTGTGGPKYETYYNGKKLKDLSSDTLSAYGLNGVPLEGSVDMTNDDHNGLNNYAAEHPINISNANLGLTKIDSFEEKPVPLKYVLTKDSLDSRVQEQLGKLEKDAKTEAEKIYKPVMGGYSDSGYIKAYGTKADNDKYVLTRVEVDNEKLLETYASKANGNDHDKIRVNTSLVNWKGPDTPQKADATAGDYKMDTGKHFDELIDMFNNVRLKMSKDWISDELNNVYQDGSSGRKKVLSITTNLGNKGPTDAELRAALAVTMDMDEPQMSTMFRSLGEKAAGVTQIKITIGKTNISTAGEGYRSTIGKIFGNNLNATDVVTLARVKG